MGVVKSSRHKKEILNQLINLFWTALCFAPLMWFWMKIGINFYFYSFIGASLIVSLLPAQTFDRLAFSSKRKFYERFGVRTIRKFVQNGDIVKSGIAENRQVIINGLSQARQYLKNIAMYERFHWGCAVFFLLTAIAAFFRGYFMTGMLIIAANLLYNFSSILLQQYNKLRIKKMTSG